MKKQKYLIINILLSTAVAIVSYFFLPKLLSDFSDLGKYSNLVYILTGPLFFVIFISLAITVENKKMKEKIKYYKE